VFQPFVEHVSSLHELDAAAVGTDGDQVDHHQQHDQAHQENEATGE